MLRRHRSGQADFALYRLDVLQRRRVVRQLDRFVPRGAGGLRALDLLRRRGGEVSAATSCKRATLEARRALGARRLRRRLAEETARDPRAACGRGVPPRVWETGQRAGALAPRGRSARALRALYAGRLPEEAAASGATSRADPRARVRPPRLGSRAPRPRDRLAPRLQVGAEVSGRRSLAGRSTTRSSTGRATSRCPGSFRGRSTCRASARPGSSSATRVRRASSRTRVRSWIAANPPGTGVNWACTMDVALRAVSWIWALTLFEGAAFSADFRGDPAPCAPPARRLDSRSTSSSARSTGTTSCPTPSA